MPRPLKGTAYNQNVQWQLRLLWNPIVVGLVSILKDRYRNYWTSFRPTNRQYELSKHICSLNIFNKMESSQKIPTLYIVNGAYVSPKVFNKLKNMYVAMYSEWLQWISKFMSPHKQEKLCAWCRWAIRLFCLRRICFPVLMQCDQEPFRVVIGNLG